MIAGERYFRRLKISDFSNSNAKPKGLAWLFRPMFLNELVQMGFHEFDPGGEFPV